MIRSFKNKGTEDVFEGNNSKEARSICPRELLKVAIRKLDQIDSAGVLDDLRIPPGNRLETLCADREGQCSIRINDQFRICFVWRDGQPEDVEIVDYHR